MGGNDKRAGKLQHISEAIRERHITLSTTDPVARGSFTQVPNFILNDPNMSLGAKVTYETLAKLQVFDMKGEYPEMQSCRFEHLVG